MRIGTWNLQRGERGLTPARALQELRADFAILTEPGPGVVAGAGVVTSPPLREGRKGPEPWIAIVGDKLAPATLDIPFGRMAAAAVGEVGGVLLVTYGSVLPWGTFRTQAPELVLEGESSSEAFMRLLAEQVADIKELGRTYSEHVVMWAGDFNQHLSGPLHGGSAVKRAALQEALDDLGLLAWNGAELAAKPGLLSIDLICGPKELHISAQGRLDPMLDGKAVTDHAGYWVKLAV